MKKNFWFILILLIFVCGSCQRAEKSEIGASVSGFPESLELNLVGLEKLLNTFVLTQVVQIDIGQLQTWATKKEATRVTRAIDGAYHLQRESNLNARDYDLYLLKDKALQRKGSRRYKVLEPGSHLNDIISDQVFAWRDYWYFIQKNFGIKLQTNVKDNGMAEVIEREYIRFSTPPDKNGPEVKGYFLYNRKFKTVTEAIISCKYTEDDQTVKWFDVESELPDYSTGLGYVEVEIFFRMKIDKIGEPNALKIPDGYS